ncbi:hypothetical protein ACHAPT_006123 [Fusarium lateritium]
MYTNIITVSLLALASAAQGFKFTGPESSASLDLSRNITITWTQETSTKTIDKKFDLYWYAEPNELYKITSEIETGVDLSKGEYVWSPTPNTRNELKRFADVVAEKKAFRFLAFVTSAESKARDVYSDNYIVTGLQGQSMLDLK